jgi:hypothetical protein
MRQPAQANRLALGGVDTGVRGSAEELHGRHRHRPIHGWVAHGERRVIGVVASRRRLVAVGEEGGAERPDLDLAAQIGCEGLQLDHPKGR